MARVDQAYLRPAHMVGIRPPTLFRWCASTRHHQPVCWPGLNAAAAGIFTKRAARAILDGRPLDQLAVGELASGRSCRAPVRPGWAMPWLLLRQRVHRLVVVDNGPWHPGGA